MAHANGSTPASPITVKRKLFLVAVTALGLAMLIAVPLLGRHEPFVTDGGERAQCASQFHMLAGDGIYKKNPLDGIVSELSGPTAAQYRLAEKCQDRRNLYGLALQGLITGGTILAFPAVTVAVPAIFRRMRRNDDYI